MRHEREQGGDQATRSDDRMLSMNDAAAYLGLHPKSLRRLCADQSIGVPVIRVGGRLRFRWSDLQDWLDNRRVSAA